MFDISKEFETMYSPFTPTHHFSLQQLKEVKRKHDIVDLKKIMEDSKDELEKCMKLLEEKDEEKRK